MASSSLPIEARKELGARERLIEQSGCKDRAIAFSAPVRLYPDADYHPSPRLTDWMGADERRELEELLSCIEDLDDEMQGLSVGAATVLIQWDFDCLALVELLKQWTVGVLTNRVRRPVGRGDHPADVFFRVHGEYLNVMRPLLTREDSLGRTISYPVAEYAAYLIGNLLKDVGLGSERGKRHGMAQVRNANELEKVDADRSIALVLATPVESAGVSEADGHRQYLHVPTGCTKARGRSAVTAWARLVTRTGRGRRLRSVQAVGDRAGQPALPVGGGGGRLWA